MYWQRNIVNTRTSGPPNVSDPGRRDVVFGSVLGSDETVHMSAGRLCHESGEGAEVYAELGAYYGSARNVMKIKFFFLKMLFLSREQTVRGRV